MKLMLIERGRVFKNSGLFRYRVLAVWVCCGLAVLGLADNRAQGQTWDGGGTNNNWSTANNWNPDVAPPNNGTDALIFTGTVRTTPNVDTPWSLTTITFDAAATTPFTLNGNDLTFSAGGTVTNGSTATHTINNNLISDATGLSLTGNDGVLSIGGDIDLSAGGGATLTVDGGVANVIISGSITGTGGNILKNGTSTLSLTGSNTYTGDTVINAGTLIANTPVGADATLNGGTFTVNSTVSGNTAVNGGTLEFGAGNFIGTLTVAGGDLAASGQARTVFKDITFTGDFGVSGSQDLTIASDIALTATRTVTVTNTANTEFSGDLTGTGGLVKEGSETLVLSGINTFSGAVTLNDGTLGLGSDTALGTSNMLTINGGNLEARGSSREIPSAVTVTVGGDFGVTGGNDLTLAGNMALSADRTVTVTNTAATVFSGVLSGAGGLTLGSGSTGTLELSGVNTYTGDTEVDAGTLNLTGSIAGDAATNGGALNVAGTVGGDATINGGTTTVNGTVAGNTTITTGTLALGSDTALGGTLTLLGGNLQATGGARDIAAAFTVNGNFGVIGSEDLTLSSGGTLNSVAIISVTNTGSTVFSGVLTGAGGVVKDGAQSLELSGANTYTGDTIVTNGALLVTGSLAGDAKVNAGGTLTVNGSIAGTTNLSGGTLQLGSDTALGGTLILSGGSLEATSGARTIASALNVNGDFVVGGSQDLTLTGAMTLAANRTVTVTNTANTEFSGVISGANSITLGIASTGSLELSGANTHTGNTVVNGGTLLLTGSLTNDAVINAGGTLTVDGTIGGDATVTGGTLTVNTAGTVTGDATLNSGTMTVDGTVSGDASITAGTLQIDANGTVAMDLAVSGGAAVVDGTISGNATVTGGTLTINQGGSITNNTTLNGGTLAFGGDNVLGGTLTFLSGNFEASGGARTLSNALTINGAFGVTGNENLTLTGIISGTDGVNKSGNGTLELTNTNTYTGDTVVNAGTLLLTGSITNDAIVNAGTLTVDGTIGGDATLAGGTLTVNAGGTVSTDLTVSGGTATVDGSVSGDATLNGGATIVNGTIAGNTTLTGGVLAFGSDTALTGTLDISGGNIQAVGAARTVSNTLTVGGDFSIAGDEDFTLASDFALSADRTVTIINTGNTVLSGVISGADGFTKAGATTTTMELSGANTYTGNTVVNGGTLIVSGSITSDVTINPTMGSTISRLAGGGTITGNVVNSGILNAGNPSEAGTMTITGNLTLNAGGFTTVEITSPTTADLYSVSGAVTIDGGLELLLLNGYSPNGGDTFTVITAGGGVSGAFDSTVPVSASLLFDVSVNANDVVLSAINIPYANSAATGNQAAVAGVLEGFRASPTGDTATVIAQLNTLGTSQLQAALDQIVPEEIGALSNVNFGSLVSQSGNVSSRLTEVRLGHRGHSSNNLRLANLDNNATEDLIMLSAAQDGDPWSYGTNRTRQDAQQHQENPSEFFVAGSGTLGEVDGTASQAGYDFFTGQITMGMDHRFDPRAAGGFMLGYAHSNVDVDSDGGEVDVNSVRFGLYGTIHGGAYLVQNMFLNAMIGGGYHLYDTERKVQFGALNRTATASPDGFEFNAMLELGVEVPVANTGWVLYPVISVIYSRLDIDSYTESGAGALNLTVDEQTVESFLTRAGVRVTTEHRAGDTMIIPQFQALYQNESEDQARTVTARFAGAGGGAFGFQTTDIGQDSVILGAGVTVIPDDTNSFYINYDVELGRDNYTVQNLQAGVHFWF